MRLLVSALLACLLLVSCSSDKNDAQEAADRLAAQLSDGDLSAASFDSAAAPQEYTAVVAGLVAGLGEANLEVEAAEVTVEDGRGAVPLRWRWALGNTEWEYESTAELTKNDDGWAAVWAPSLVEPSLEDGETLRVRTLPAERGAILGADDALLVTERPVIRYGVDKTKVAPDEAVTSARQVAELLGIDPEAYAEKVEAAGDQAFVEALALRLEDAREIDPAYGEIPGAVALDAERDLALSREFAAPILGRVGEATAEIVEKSEGRVRAGDTVGLSGLQQRYDEQLAGTSGIEVLAASEDGSRSVHAVEPVEGAPLVTTLDVDVQRAAEGALAGFKDVVSAAVVLRPSTGEVLAAANGPADDGLNAATFGQYAPGSTFKVVTSLAMLRNGMTPASPVDCPASLVVDGKRFENYDDYPASELGRITLRQAVAHSCNTAFIGLVEEVDPAELTAAAAALGLGEDRDVGFPAYFGQVPAPESDTGAAAALIGQGRVLASPMAMAAVAASVQAGGTVVPHLLADHVPEAAPGEPLTDSEVAALRELMGAVVTEGSGRFLADLGDLGEVRANTGTAEYGEAAADGSLATHAWMIGARGDLAAAVFVGTGQSGSATAGPVLERLLARTGVLSSGG